MSDATPADATLRVARDRRVRGVYFSLSIVGQDHVAGVIRKYRRGWQLLAFGATDYDRSLTALAKRALALSGAERIEFLP